MTYLVDTHALLWYMEDNPRLSTKAIKEIENPENTIWLSKASLWEIAIKLTTGKLKLTCQAIIHNFTIITDDKKFNLYLVQLLT